VLEGGFRAWEDGRWCVWVLGSIRWPSRGFSHTWPSKEAEKEAEKAEQGEESPETLEREAVASLTTLSTPSKQL